jgi:cytochrome c peroxidase
MLNLRAGILSALLLGTATVVGAEPPTFLPNLFPFPNPNGVLKTFNESGKLDLTGPFFQSLGTNGRSCASCHQPGDAWSVSAAHVAERFEQTQGLDPIFRTNDGSNCDQHIDTKTVAGRRHAYSLLTSRGLIRIALPVPANAEFEVVSVSNPYKCDDTSTLSMYRRPLPTTNLRFLTTVMWDGRESSLQTGTNPIKPTGGQNPDDLLTDLRHQSLDATNGHAQASTQLSDTQKQQIVNFEMGLSTAQTFDFGAGSLDAHGARGGPVALSNQFFYVGINDPLGQNPVPNKSFDPVIFTLFTPTWADEQFHNKNRASILRGQTLFNSHLIDIKDVAGINDALGVKTLRGTCGTCHDSPNVGNHSVIAPLNIGIADVANPLNPLGLDYLPVIKLRQKADPTKEISTTDPGRALVTGKWADIGKFKGPILRGLSARAPYFHNGSAESLKDVVEFYNVRFGMGLTESEKADLAAFLSTL